MSPSPAAARCGPSAGSAHERASSKLSDLSTAQMSSGSRAERALSGREDDCDVAGVSRRRQERMRTRRRKTTRRSLWERALLVALMALVALCRSLKVEAAASQVVLLDTTEQAALGWTKYPDGGPQTRTPGWVEESFTNFTLGINWRSFVVCDVAFNSVNNWLWTPFIERHDAQRLHIEIKFTMRDCNLFPQMVLSCKETFALLYKEADAPFSAQPAAKSAGGAEGGALLSAANASFAQSDSFALVDAIAADEGRFTSNEDVVINTELRSVPVSKRGVYFAFRDQGACLSLISVRVFHLKCPAHSTDLARFEATPTGREQTSLVAVEGACVANALQLERPRMFCAADGSWQPLTAPGACRCAPGFEPSPNKTRCQPCAPASFKPAASNEQACQPCPAHSLSAQAGAAECACREGFFRAAKDARQAPCTQPPGPPQNLSVAYLDSGALVLQWQPPRYTGGRDDLAYRLVCAECDAQPAGLASSPQFAAANFSETSYVLAGLAPSSAYRFLVYALNGVSQQAAQAPHFSEISVQTAPAQPQSPANTLSAQGGLQLTPIYNLRALQGARPSELVLVWEAAPLGPAEGAASSGAPLAEAELLPALYELRFQPAAAAQEFIGAGRRSAYPAALIGAPDSNPTAAQSVTTTNRAVTVAGLQPRTEYAFQIRAKWAHAHQWTEFSVPVYKNTSAGPAASGLQQQQQSMEPPAPFELGPPRGGHAHLETPARQEGPASSWLNTFGLALVCLLVAFVAGSATLLHYRKNSCLSSLSTGFGTLSGSTYGGVYGSGAGTGLMGGGTGIGPLGFGSPLQFAHHHHAHSAGSAGGLIAGSNATSRSSSGAGAGNVVQNFIAATLGQIGHAHHQANAARCEQKGAEASAHTLGAESGKLFAASAQRNHYHQTLGASIGGQQQQQQHLLPGQGHHLEAAAGGQVSHLFKYRTLAQASAGANANLANDPQAHIYDDLDLVACSPMQRLQARECEHSQVSVDALLSRGEFGDLCAGFLRLREGGQKRVSVRTLRAQADERAKLDFLLEAALMAHFEHANVCRLEAFVGAGERPLLAAEWTPKGPLDAYLRDNKGAHSAGQLIAMLRGVADAMQYLAKQNFVHKDLAARNILVSADNVCKVANLANFYPTEPANPNAAEYTNHSASTTSSLSSDPTTTPSSVANQPPAANLWQLAPLVDQLVAERLAPASTTSQQQQSAAANCNQKLPVRWTALEAIAFRRFTWASDVWSFGVVAWEVMSEGERPYWNWSNQSVIKALEQGYRLPQPENCPEPLYRLMLDCWLKERAARPTFGQIVKALERLLSPYDDPFGAPELAHSGAHPQLAAAFPPRLNNQEPAYYETYNPMGQLIGATAKSAPNTAQWQSVDEWLSAIKMSRYRDNFQRHQINSLQYVARLSQAELNLIGVHNGQHLKRFLNAIAALRTTTQIGASGEGYLV